MLLNSLWDRGVDTAFADPAATVAPWVRPPPSLQNTKIFWPFRTGFRSSDRRQYLFRWWGILITLAMV